MDTNLRKEISRLHAQVCGGLADQNRIYILYALSEGPNNVGNLVSILNLPQPTVSHHLKILRDRNMVVSERAGQSVIYSLADERIIQALDLLRAFLADSLQSQNELAQYTKKTSPPTSQ